MVWRQVHLALLIWISGAIGALAQPATLLADNLVIQGDNQIQASGNVEVFSGDIHLKATRIVYDGARDVVSIEGPITLIQGDGSVVLASAGELSADLRDGILQGARLVLEQQVQIAAAEIHRVGGRYSQLYKTVASSCRICNNQGPPLWQIRADNIVHDTQTRFLYFQNAQLRIGNVPVVYIPRLRLPDPTLKRATGFLRPEVKTNTLLGTGIKIPYFVTLGDHADLTFTPYISSRTKTLELRYRQAFRRGDLQFDAALTRDEIRAATARSYLFGRGTFDLPRNYTLQFDIELTSDPAYLLEYGYSGKDRLDSALSVTRTRAQDYFNAGIINFKTLRGSELAIDDQLPNFQAEISYERRFYPDRIGGEASWSLGVEAHSRDSALDVLGRDVVHLGGRLNWGRSETFGPGIVGRIGLDLTADAYAIAQDSNYAPTLAFVTPGAELELRWPWVKAGASGAHMVFEPVVHLAVSRNYGTNVPNEDSTIVEFDGGNLFAINRFPGDDQNDDGFRATLGAQWTRYDPGGWSLGLAVGRVYRLSDPALFSTASGLDGSRSDWLAAAQFKLQPGFSLTTRALIAEDASLTKAEARLGWSNDRLSLNSTYGWIVPDLSENRPNVVSQLTLDSSYRFQRHWLASLEYLYDFSAHRATKASFGLEYTNECVSVDLSLSRRFTSSTSVTPTTDVGFSVELLGFGAGDSIPRRSCTGL